MAPQFSCGAIFTHVDLTFLEIPADSPFSYHNLPYGIFRPQPGGRGRVGVAIGPYVLDLSVLEARGLFRGPALRGATVFSRPTLNDFMALGNRAWDEARTTVQQLLNKNNPVLRDNRSLRQQAILTIDDIELLMPVAIGDYTDFYSSLEHASNVGAMFRDPENPLLDNWRHLPVAYHGRVSSIVVGGTPIRRPNGQVWSDEVNAPLFGPTQELDFELEIGFFTGPGNDLGRPVSIEEAAEHIFGMVLVNDWSARDIQRWEYRPLGPFLGKNFATSISPWVVPMAALDPFRCPGPEQDPLPLPYLTSDGDRTFDIELEARLATSEMERSGADAATITRTNGRNLYWDVGQQLAHHTVNGCNIRPGDLMASGTISGSDPGSYGSMLELSRGGERPITLPGGEERRFLEDGDRLTLTGWCQGDGYRVGFGEVSAVIEPALSGE